MPSKQAKVILLCGKICSGKTTYAARLRREMGAVVLSADEILLSLFGQHLGDKHDLMGARTQAYLFRKSLDLLEVGIPVILDWGFWTKADRAAARAFYETRGIPCEFHYIDIPDDLWAVNITERNARVEAAPTTAYYVDENLANKLQARFETPSRDEMDVWYINTRP